MSQASTNSSLNDFDTILGTPSAQKIIKFLVVWDKLSVKELAAKSSVSESQIHSSLKNLKAISLVEHESRGIYTLSDSPFSVKLKEAYYTGILEEINKKITSIKKLLKNNDLEQAKANFSLLKMQYDPFLKAHFLFIIDSLAKQILSSLM